MFEMAEKVKFEDVDIYGIIHHPKVLYYFERVRNTFFENNRILVNKVPYGIVLRNIEIEYKSPLLMFDNFIIRQTVSDLQKYKFTLEYEVRKEKKLMISSRIDFVLIDLNTKKLIFLPEEIRLLLKKEYEKK